MQTFLRGKDMISTQEWTKSELDTVFEAAKALKLARAMGKPHAHLRDKTLAMLFFFTSTRTRSSFEAGMAQLGGHAAFIDSSTTQISHGDTAKEIGEILDLNESQVKVYLFRARKRMKDIIKKLHNCVHKKIY